jgi:hypothetical protein
MLTRKAYHPKVKWTALAGCLLLVQCSSAASDIVAVQPRHVPIAAFFEAEPTTTDQANACVNQINENISVPTSAFSATTGSSCSGKYQWGASIDIYVDSRRDEAPDGTFIEQTQQTGTGVLFSDCSTSDTTKNPYTCNKTFQGLNCQEPGDTEFAGGYFHHQVYWLHFFQKGEIDIQKVSNCLGILNITVPYQMVIGTSSQASSNCNNAAHGGWLSDKPSVVTVSSSGMLHAVASGVANITAECWTNSTSAEVTVVERDVQGGPPGHGNAIIDDCGYYVYDLSLDGGATWGQIGSAFYACP